MDMNEYQGRAIETAVYPGKKTLLGLFYCAAGASGEAGEALEKVKKLVRLSTPQEVIAERNNPNLTYEAREAIQKELGDVLWYLSAGAWELGLTLEDIAEANLRKLAQRRAEGTITGEGDNR